MYGCKCFRAFWSWSFWKIASFSTIRAKSAGDFRSTARWTSLGIAIPAIVHNAFLYRPKMISIIIIYKSIYQFCTICACLPRTRWSSLQPRFPLQSKGCRVPREQHLECCWLRARTGPAAPGCWSGTGNTAHVLSLMFQWSGTGAPCSTDGSSETIWLNFVCCSSWPRAISALWPATI